MTSEKKKHEALAKIQFYTITWIYKKNYRKIMVHP